ncbi:MAG TPA: diguanylate cyclase [Symbiobacteriaceae bacterium]|jgi:diguanylate cyclase (GGDEF)-like protein|nr:diguanylate cyclase [Symbiobacteriaceae bacterium]
MRRFVKLVVASVTGAGLLAVVVGARALLAPGAHLYQLHLVTLAVCFALLTLWPQRLPSGATFLPGVVLSAAGMFLLPPSLAVLVPIPGLVFYTAAHRGNWWSYPLTIGHGAVSLCLGAVTFRLLAPAGPLEVPAVLPGALAALLVHETVQRFISTAIVAYRQNRKFGEQARLTALDTTWGSLGMALMGLLAALSYQHYGVWGLILEAILLACFCQTFSYHTQLATWQQAARTDGLTGIGNRAAWEEFLRDSRHGAGLPGGTLIVIDLDGFKKVNDQFGHAAGDQLLRELAGALEQKLRRTDRIFRFGGDEFVLFIHHAPEADGFVRERVGRVVEQVTRGWNSQGYAVTASIGMATVPAEAPNLREAFVLADSRMYGHKDRHRRHR